MTIRTNPFAALNEKKEEWDDQYFVHPENEDCASDGIIGDELKIEKPLMH